MGRKTGALVQLQPLDRKQPELSVNRPWKKRTLASRYSLVLRKSTSDSCYKHLRLIEERAVDGQRQIEQDLIRVLVELFNDPFLAEQLRFRRGTAQAGIMTR